VNPNKHKPKPIFLQPWAFVTFTFLVTSILVLSLARDYRVSETRELKKLQRDSIKAQKRRVSFFFSFLFFSFFSFSIPWECDFGFLKILKILS